MEEALGAAKGQRRPERLGYRSGVHCRKLVTRMDQFAPRVPQDWRGR